MKFVFIDWLDAVVAWQPPGIAIDGVCRSCEDSRLRTMGVLSVLPHDLIHRFATDVAAQIVARPGAITDASSVERDVYAEIETILPEVAELWEQHASPRLRAWIAEHIDGADEPILLTLQTAQK